MTATGAPTVPQCSLAAITRTIVYRQITNFQSGGDVGRVDRVKISANGSKIIFTTDYQKIFTINADGSDFAKVFDYGTPQWGVPYIDINADGSKIIWAQWRDAAEIYIADSDGANRQRLATDLPAPGAGTQGPSLRVGLHITADGQSVYFIQSAGDKNTAGGYRVAASGGPATQLFSYLQMAALFGLNGDEFNGYWAFTSGLGASADGARMAFGTVNFQAAGHTIGFDGTSLHVHISPEKDHVQVRFRVDGKLHEVPAPPKSMFLPIISRLKILANMDIAVSRVPQDGRFTVKMKNKDINIRVSTIPSIHGENLVLRLLDTSTSIYSLELLGMNESDRQKIEGIITKPYGMILSTGPTGSGKSTSLYSILKRINQPDINIITVEDPVEYRIDKIRQVQLNRKAGMTFASGLRSILRQDPDVIMVGEIRDSETASIAVQAALTGHRVLSTLHTNDAAGAMTRMMDMGIEPFLVSSVMLVSFAQRLVRRTCPHCRQPYTPSPEAAKYWRLKNVDVSGMVVGQGCFNCMHTGFKGRTGIFEVLVIDDMVRDMILRHCSSHEINRAAIEAGSFVTLRDNALEKAVQGVTSLEEAASAVLM